MQNKKQHRARHEPAWKYAGSDFKEVFVMGTVVVGVIVIGIVGLVVKSMVRDKKNGKSLQCGNDCKHCGGHCRH